METHWVQPVRADRSVPKWPNIRDDGITPAGWGYKSGDKICFCAEYNSCNLYIPYTLTSDPDKARAMFEQSLPALDDMWPNCGSRSFIFRWKEEETKILLEFGFSLIEYKIAKQEIVRKGGV